MTSLSTARRQSPFMAWRRGAISAATAVALLAAAAVPAAVVPAWSQDADPVVARVNGTDIRQSDLNLAEEDIGQQAATMTPEAKQEYLITYVSDIILVASAAERRKVGEDSEFKRRLAFNRNKMLMESLLESEGKAAVTDSAMREVYAEAVKQMSDQTEVRARHILVPTEAEARDILTELRKGGDFEAISKARSKDPGAAAKGGDLGYFSKDQMVPEFAEVAFKLGKGELSDPVKTQFGWHVIKVEDQRSKAPPTFENVKPQVETFVMRRAQAALVTKLRGEAKIERLDKK